MLHDEIKFYIMKKLFKNKRHKKTKETICE